MPRTASSYLEDVRQGIAAIGAAVGFDVELYRAINSVWTLIDPDKGFQTLSNDAIPSYPGYVYEGLPKYGSFRVIRKGEKPENGAVTSFYMSPFPGCCALAISTGANVSENYRRRGVNKAANQLRQALAGVTGYTGVVATEVIKNETSIRMLKSNGFKPLYQLKNKRTNNLVDLMIKELA
jgi:hypothetical protein